MNLRPHGAEESVFTSDMISPTDIRTTIADQANLNSSLFYTSPTRRSSKILPHTQNIRSCPFS